MTSENDGIDIDVSRLTASDAGELRDLFEAGAGQLRQAGRGAQENFMLGLAGLLDSFAKNRAAATGEALPEPMTLNSSGAVDLAALTFEDTLRGAHVLVKVGEALQGDGHEALANVFADMADSLTESAKGKQAALAAATTERPN